MENPLLGIHGKAELKPKTKWMKGLFIILALATLTTAITPTKKSERTIILYLRSIQLAMELYLVIICLLYGAIAWVSIQSIVTAIKRNSKRLPPGPFPLPLVGNIFSLGKEPLKSLNDLAKTYGPVMCFHLGWQTTVVVNSASLAKEVLLTNDVSFANRYVPDAWTALEHDKSCIGLRPADARWKVYRKICISHVFANSRLDATQGLRMKKVNDLLSYVETSRVRGEAVNVGQVAFTTSLNFVSNTVFSIDLGDPTSDIAREFKLHAANLAVEASILNLGDYYPLIKPLDLQRIKKRSTAIMGKVMALLDKKINERLEEREYGDIYEDVLDALLTLVQDTKELQSQELRHILFELFTAGTETTSTTLEWAMAELMRNPQIMNKAQTELQEVIGLGNPVHEQDAPRLPYLQAIIKETLRLHAPAPVLLPRRVNQDTPLGDFIVPKNAQVLVNVYAIQRDPTLWDNPDSFQPERFLRSSIDIKGQSFELIPFGSGRRICPGLTLANRMLHLMLASLIHGFNWKLSDGVKPDTLDMNPKLGFSLSKAKPLLVFPLKK